MRIQTTKIQHVQSALTADEGMVSANHYLAAEAGAKALMGGGNAVDAAIATSFAAGVVEPAMSGIGGRGYIVIHSSKNDVSTVIDGHERAPGLSRDDMFELRDDGPEVQMGWGSQVGVAGDANSIGHRAVAVPGVLSALWLAHKRYGKLAWHRIIEPAIQLARDGFPVSLSLTLAISRNLDKLARYPSTAAIFLRDGRVPNPGERLVQHDLGRTLELIARNGIAEFYDGSISKAIVEEMDRSDGILSLHDLSGFTPREWDKPLTGTFHGYQILTVPEATGGVPLVQILNLLEFSDIRSMNPFDADYFHVLLEALRIGFVDRNAFVDDPEFADVPFKGLLSKSYVEERWRTFDPARSNSYSKPGNPWKFDDAGGLSIPRASDVHLAGADNDTTHFCAVDSERTVVSITQSIIDAFGSGVVVPETGILLNSAMHNFNPVPGSIGSIGPNKRSVHNGAPCIVLGLDGQPMLAIGGAGGTKIVSGLIQILSNVLMRNMQIQEAISMPRVHNEGGESLIEAAFAPGMIDELRGRGHSVLVEESTYGTPVFSRINGIAIGTDGTMTSGVDVFGDAGAAAIN